MTPKPRKRTRAPGTVLRYQATALRNARAYLELGQWRDFWNCMADIGVYNRELAASLRRPAARKVCVTGFPLKNCPCAGCSALRERGKERP